MIVNIFFVFWLLVALFATIGAMRGWARELLVVFSVVLALFMINLLESYVLRIDRPANAVAQPTPVVTVVTPAPAGTTAPAETQSKINVSPTSLFWIRSAVLAILTFFGYQTALLQKFVNMNKLARERVQDTILGILVGALNGVLIVGCLWSFMHKAGYPFVDFIKSPSLALDEPLLAQKIEMFIRLMPPDWLGEPWIYVAVGVAFLFVLVVFI